MGPLAVGTVLAMIPLHCVKVFGDRTHQVAEDDDDGQEAGHLLKLQNGESLIKRKVLVTIRDKNGNERTILATFIKNKKTRGEAELQVNGRRWAVPGFGKLVTGIKKNMDGEAIDMTSDCSGSISFSDGMYAHIVDLLSRTDEQSVTITVYGTYKGMGGERTGEYPLKFERKE